MNVCRGSDPMGSDFLNMRQVNVQRVIIVQIPSEAMHERLINERLNDENADGWRAVEMMDHNGLLIIRLERTLRFYLAPTLSTVCAVCGGSTTAVPDDLITDLTNVAAALVLADPARWRAEIKCLTGWADGWKRSNAGVDVAGQDL